MFPLFAMIFVSLYFIYLVACLGIAPRGLVIATRGGIVNQADLRSCLKASPEISQICPRGCSLVVQPLDIANMFLLKSDKSLFRHYMQVSISSEIAKKNFAKNTGA